MPGLSGPDSPLKAGGRLAGGGQFRTHTATSAKLLIPLLALLILLTPVSVAVLMRAPERLQDVQLVGAAPDAPTRLVVVMDVSGSMRQYAPAREQALADLVSWGAQTMRPTDSLSVFAFATEGQCLLSETTIADLSNRQFRLRALQSLGGGTSVGAVLPILSAELGPEPHILAVITDTGITAISRQTIQQTASSLGFTSVTAISPKGTHPHPNWQAAFPMSRYETASPDDADAIGLALARTIASATGQQVQRTRR